MSRKVLILGHRGMLGNAVHSYFNNHNNYITLTTEKRWGDPLFNEELLNTEADFIINCIGAIPQKKLPEEAYRKINIDLPTFLETIGKKVVHPTTDCEFSGTIPYPKKYSVIDERDAQDAYGKSKADISFLIENSFNNTKMIRVSIIGHELNSHVSFLDWFLHSENEVNGYTNHYWNGVTTLQWAKLCENLLENWDDLPVLNQFGTTDSLSKFEILSLVKKVYEKDVVITPKETEFASHKCLVSHAELPTIEEQLVELKKFYGK